MSHFLSKLFQTLKLKCKKSSVYTLGALVAIPCGFKLLIMIILMLNIYSISTPHHASASITLPECKGEIVASCDGIGAKECSKFRTPGFQCEVVDKQCQAGPACLFCSDGFAVPGEACDDGNIVNGDGCSSECELEWMAEGYNTNIELLKKAIKGEKDPLEGDKLNFCLGYLHYLANDTKQAESIFFKLIERENMQIENFPYLYYFEGIVAYIEELNDKAAKFWNEFLGFLGVEKILNLAELTDGFNYKIMGSQITPVWYPLMTHGDIYDDFVSPKGERLQEYNKTLYPEGAYEICELEYVFCGNGVIEEKEICDDGNNINGDGCSNSCQLEKGRICEGEPSECTDAICGDGDRHIEEECDDGNTENGDGCSSICEAEEGYICGKECYETICSQEAWKIVSDEEHGNILENKKIGSPSFVYNIADKKSEDDIAYLTYRNIKDIQTDEGTLEIQQYKGGNWYTVNSKIAGHLVNINTVYANKVLYIVYKNLDTNIISVTSYDGDNWKTYSMKEKWFYQPDISTNGKGIVHVSLYDSDKEQYEVYQFDNGSFDLKVAIQLNSSANGDVLMKNELQPGFEGGLYWAIANTDKKYLDQRILEFYQIDGGYGVSQIGKFEIKYDNYGFDFIYDIASKRAHMVYQNLERKLDYYVRGSEWNVIFEDLVFGIHDEPSINYYSDELIHVGTHAWDPNDYTKRDTILLDMDIKKETISRMGERPTLEDYISADGEVAIDSMIFANSIYLGLSTKLDQKTDPFLTFMCPMILDCAGKLSENTINTSETYIYNRNGIEDINEITLYERAYDNTEILDGECEFYCEEGYIRELGACTEDVIDTIPSCDLPRGGLLADGESITSYQNSSVECGLSCESEILTCDAGILSGNYQNESCLVGACPPDCDLPWGGVIVDGESTTGYQDSSVLCGLSCESEILTCNVGVLSGNYQNESCLVGACPPDCDLPWGGVIIDGESTTAYQHNWVSCGLICESQIVTCDAGVLDGEYQYESCSQGACPLPCDLPRGGTIEDGESVIAYQNNLVSCGLTCQSENRICTDGALGGLYTNPLCSVAGCGGGGHIVHKDDCCEDSDLPGANEDCEDYSPSYYDDTCEGRREPVYNPSGPGSSTQDTHYTADILLTRILAAEMIYQIAIELGMNHNYKQECYDFVDLKDYSSQKYFAVQACLYGYMGYEQDGIIVAEYFNPDEKVSRAQISTILSRLLFGSKNNLLNLDNIDTSVINYWSFKHAQALNDVGVIEQISPERLSKNETVDFFNIMINRTLDMLGKDIESYTHQSAQDGDITNALQNTYNKLNPQTKTTSTREDLVNRFKSLFGTTYKSSYESDNSTDSQDIHNSANIDPMIDQTILEKLDSKIDKSDKGLESEHKSKLESTFDSLFDRLRPQSDIQSVNTLQEVEKLGSPGSIEELIDKNPL